MNIRDGSRRQRIAAVSLLAALPAAVGLSSLCLPTSARQGIAGAYKKVRAALAVPARHAHAFHTVAKGGPVPLPRYVYSKDDLLPHVTKAGAHAATAHAATGPVQIDEPVQTFDVLRPPPAFNPVDSPQNTINRTPVFTPDEQWIVYSSNRNDANGHFHIWAVPARGGDPVQVTTSSSDGGDDLFPVVSPNGDKLAFVSDAATPGQHNLYSIPFSTATLGSGVAATDVDTLASLTLRNDIAVGFTDVGRPTWSPAEDQIVFSALTSEGGSDDNLPHLYYLYTGSRGYLRSAGAGTPNPPGKITSGPESDTDPAWSPDGSFIAFASSASAFGNTGQGVFPDPTSPAQETTPVAASGTQTATGSVQPTGIFLLTNAGTVPSSLASNGGLITNPGTVDGGPAWSPNASSDFAGFLAFSRASASTANAPSQIFFFQANNGGVPQLEPTAGATQLITDNPNTTASATNPPPAPTFSDLYPSWPAFVSGVALTYQSNRSISYNDPANSDAPSETAISIAQGTNGLGTSYVGVLESEIEYVNPPTLLRYNSASGEIVHITQGSDPTSASTRYVTPGTPVTFEVRLSNREAGIDNTGGPKDQSSGVAGPNVFIQIKDPDSKYQDSKQIEHKLFTNPDDISAPLYNGDRGDLLQVFNGQFFQPGAIGGVDPNGNLISVGRIGLNTSDYTNNKKFYKHDINGFHLLGIDTTQLPFTPWGQEYECQFVNPYYNTTGNTDTTAADYGTPVFLAGWSDQDAFSAPDTSGGAPAGWLQLRKAQVQDNNGGVLYTTTWTTPTSPSDYYIDVIAFDNAKNAIQAPANNWRIYDNVWGFTTQQFGSGNGILVVSDNALGQKFAASLYGRANTSSAQNLRPTYYGAESYYTGVDVATLPNAIDYEVGSAMGSPIFNGTDPPPTTGTAPTLLTLFPYINEVTLSWAGITGTTTAPLLGYNIYRNGNLIKQIRSNLTVTDYDDVGSFFGDPTDGNAYTYMVTAVTQGTTGPVESAGVSATVTPPGLVAIGTPGLTTLPIGDPIGEVPVTDANGNVSVVKTNDDAVENTLGTFSHDANHTQYDIWRTLARGPIDEATLLNYGGTKETQPSVTPVATGATEPSASFNVAPKCVVWITPYTGDLLVGPGSFADPSTQAEITDFINGGGRLCVSGQDVASTLAPGGNSSTAPGFLGSVLGATYTATLTGAGTQTLATDAAGSENRLSSFGVFNPFVGGEPVYPTWSGIYQNGIPFAAGDFKAPKQNPLDLSTNVGYVWTQAGLVGNPPLGVLTYRTDGALTEPIEAAPYVFSYGPGFANPPQGTSITAARAQIDAISPITGITGVAPIPDLAFQATDVGNGGGVGLQYYANAKSGGRVVLGSFGLEGLGTEYYGRNFGGVNYFFPYNQRQHVLYNIVTYLRTCTVTGKISLANGTIGGGVAVPGATVYLVPVSGNIPNLPAGRTTYSATTNSSGVYAIDGVEAGNYDVVAYKSGYVSTESLTFITAMPQAPQTINLNLTKLTDGTISGQVTYPAIGANTPTPVIGATVKFVSSDGQSTVTGVTDQNGNYLISGVPAAAAPGRAYTGTATFGLGTSESETVNVLSAQNSTANFIIPGSNTLAGKVVDQTSGAGISGATVAFTDTGGTTVTTTTDASGAYTSPILEPGVFTITASLSPTYIPATVTGITLGDSPTPTPVPDIDLTKLLPGVLTGTVTFSDSGAPAAGAAVTFVSADGKSTYSGTTNGAGLYTISGVPSGPDPGDVYTGSVSLNGVTSATKTATVPNHATVTTDFTLGPVPGVFTGTVEDALTRAPLVGVTVTITSSDGATTVSATTDAKGGYTSPFVLPGTYTLTVDDRPTYQIGTLTGAVMTDNGHVVENIYLEPIQSGILTGKVTYADGSGPAANATVTFVAASGSSVTGTTNVNGVYTILNVPTAPDPGATYTGTASQRGVTSAPATVTLPSSGKVTQDFTLGPVPGDISGTVTGAADNKPIGGATLTATSTTSSAVFTATTASDGTYTLANVTPGAYTVTCADDPYFLSQSVSVNLADDKELTENFSLKATPSAVIGGLVTIGSLNKIVANASVVLTDSTGNTVATTTTSSTTTTGTSPTGDGKPVNYSIVVTTPGTYTLTITDSGFAPITQTVTVTLNTFFREDANIPAIKTLTAGLHLFSMPYDYSNSSWDALFGTVLTSAVSSNGTRSHIAFRTHAAVSGNRSSVAIYDPLTVQYITDPTAPADYPHPGLGYWVRLNGATDIDVPPTPITASTISVPLHAYWNMIGVPSTTQISVANLQFKTAAGTTLSFVQATSSSTGSLVIDPTLYAYDQTSNTYTTVKGTDKLQPWQGYWIKAYQDVTLIIPTGASTSSVSRK